MQLSVMIDGDVECQVFIHILIYLYNETVFTGFSQKQTNTKQPFLTPHCLFVRVLAKKRHMATMADSQREMADSSEARSDHSANTAKIVDSTLALDIPIPD